MAKTSRTHSRPLKFGIRRTAAGYQYSIPYGYGVRSTYVAALWAMAREAPEPLASEIEAEALAAADPGDLNV